jgi:hypothetical protein
MKKEHKQEFKFPEEVINLKLILKDMEKVIEIIEIMNKQVIMMDNKTILIVPLIK